MLCFRLAWTECKCMSVWWSVFDRLSVGCVENVNVAFISATIQMMKLKVFMMVLLFAWALPTHTTFSDRHNISRLQQWKKRKKSFENHFCGFVGHFLLVFILQIASFVGRFLLVFILQIASFVGLFLDVCLYTANSLLCWIVSRCLPLYCKQPALLDCF